MNGTKATVEETVFDGATEGVNSDEYLNVMANDSAGPKDGPTGDKKRPADVAHASRTEPTAATSGAKKKKKKKSSSTKKAAADALPVQEVPAPPSVATSQMSNPMFNPDANADNGNLLEVQDKLVSAQTQFSGFGDPDGVGVDL